MGHRMPLSHSGIAQDGQSGLRSGSESYCWFWSRCWGFRRKHQGGSHCTNHQYTYGLKHNLRCIEHEMKIHTSHHRGQCRLLLRCCSGFQGWSHLCQTQLGAHLHSCSLSLKPEMLHQCSLKWEKHFLVCVVENKTIPSSKLWFIQNITNSFQRKCSLLLYCIWKMTLSTSDSLHQVWAQDALAFSSLLFRMPEHFVSNQGLYELQLFLTCWGFSFLFAFFFITPQQLLAANLLSVWNCYWLPHIVDCKIVKNEAQDVQDECWVQKWISQALTFWTGNAKVTVSAQTNKGVHIHLHTCSSILTRRTLTGCQRLWNTNLLWFLLASASTKLVHLGSSHVPDRTHWWFQEWLCSSCSHALQSHFPMLPVSTWGQNTHPVFPEVE